MQHAESGRTRGIGVVNEHGALCYPLRHGEERRVAPGDASLKLMLGNTWDRVSSVLDAIGNKVSETEVRIRIRRAHGERIDLCARFNLDAAAPRPTRVPEVNASTSSRYLERDQLVAYGSLEEREIVTQTGEEGALQACLVRRRVLRLEVAIETGAPVRLVAQFGRRRRLERRADIDVCGGVRGETRDRTHHRAHRPERAVSGIVASVGEQSVAELEANEVGASAATELESLKESDLVADVRPNAGGDLPLVELQRSLLRRQCRARRIDERHRVAIRPTAPEVVLTRRIHADAQTMSCSQRERYRRACSTAELCPANVDDGECQRVVEIARAAVEVREQLPPTS